MEHRLDAMLDQQDRDYEEAQGPALKPCPFCGGEAELCDSAEFAPFERRHFYVRCMVPDCQSRGIEWTSTHHAITAWNRREGE